MPQGLGPCTICGDEASGRHYGALACHGCKGFFRRTVRLKQEYKCRFIKHCDIERDQRNSCRYCRFEKCVAMGMNAKAVQRERDSISQTPKSRKSASRAPSDPGLLPSDPGTDGGKLEPIGTPSGMIQNITPTPKLRPCGSCLTSGGHDTELIEEVDLTSAPKFPFVQRDNYMWLINIVLKGEHDFIEIRRDMAAWAPPLSWCAPIGDGKDNGAPLATAADVCELARLQLLAIVSFLKTIPTFRNDLSPEDQAAMVRNGGAEFLLLSLAYRSLGRQDVLLLSDEKHVLPRNSVDLPFAAAVIDRILDELVGGMRRIGIEVAEFCILRFLALWNPDVMSTGAQQLARHKRKLFQCTLEYYELDRHAEDPGRLTELLLLLVSAKCIAHDVRECAQLSASFGVIQLDALMDDILTKRTVVEMTARLMEMTMAVQPAAVQYQATTMENVYDPGITQLDDFNIGEFIAPIP